ncbi:hypothetical protein D3C87_548160 [compost metagenome]
MKQLNRYALIELVAKIRNTAGQTEEENDALLNLFMKNVPDPNAAIYNYDIACDDLWDEEVLDKALAYIPFIL